MNDNVSSLPQNYLQEFQSMENNWRQLLANMLEFNPFFRQSARELLKNPMFDDIRIIENEKQSGDKLKLMIDADESFEIGSPACTINPGITR